MLTDTIPEPITPDVRAKNMPPKASPRASSPGKAGRKAYQQILIESLHRCFLWMQNYAEKDKMKVKLGPIQQRLSLLQHMKSQDGLVMSVSSNSVDHHEMSVEEIDEEIETLSKQKKEINGKLFEIESRRGSTISPEDITVLLQQCFHYNPADGEVERMIFEVDETMDGRVNWDDFQLTYMRNINDKTGLEPYGLHNVISFGMHQAEGKITVGEAKHLLKKCRNYTETQINETVVRVVKLPPSGEEQK